MRITKGLFLPLILTVSSAVFAQKQTENVPAPAVVRVDGKLTEWGTIPFQVNKPTKLSYIVSNDQRNLYLVIQSEDSLVTSRILLTGMEFMINTAGKKKEGPTISFPLIDKASLLTAPGAKKLETKELNRKMLSTIKEIKLTGFKDIKEPTISIYNEYGIKSVGAFDDKENLTYELAIPLSLLGITPDNTDDLAYNIKINGSANSQLAGAGGFGGGDRGFGGGRGGDRPVFVRTEGGPQGGNRAVFNPNRFYEATDFWINLKLTKPKTN